MVLMACDVQYFLVCTSVLPYKLLRTHSLMHAHGIANYFNQYGMSCQRSCLDTAVYTVVCGTYTTCSLLVIITCISRSI